MRAIACRVASRGADLPGLPALPLDPAPRRVLVPEIVPAERRWVEGPAPRLPIAPPAVYGREVPGWLGLLLDVYG